MNDTSKETNLDLVFIIRLLLTIILVIVTDRVSVGELLPSLTSLSSSLLTPELPLEPPSELACLPAFLLAYLLALEPPWTL